MEQILGGLLGSLVIAGLAYWKYSLTKSGVAAAILIGTILYACGSLPWFGTMIAFFVSSSVLSKWKQTKKEAVEAVYEKTGRRDGLQVLANGGLATLLAWIHALWPFPIFWFLFLGVMATVNADTWATEIGGLSRTQPIFILTGRRVPRGTSGGISGLGTMASIAGALFVGIAACFFTLLQPKGSQATEWILLSARSCLGILVFTTVAGTIGSLSDSIMGASVQRMYQCKSCGRTIEKGQHCGQKADLIRGWPFFNNDTVNAVSSLIGGITAGLIAYGMGYHD